MSIIAIIAIIFAAFGIGVYMHFAISEGGDERGKSILSSAAHISFSVLCAGFAFHLIYIEFFNPSIDHVQLSIAIWMCLVFLSNAASITLQRRRMA